MSPIGPIRLTTDCTLSREQLRTSIHQSVRSCNLVQQMTNEITIKVDHVTKSFGDFTAVTDLSLSIRAGRIFGLLGPNGAGKTTSIRMIVNITAPDSGSIELFGQKIDSRIQDRIVYLPEERGLYKSMKVSEQLRFLAQLKNIT